jgi:hypothetical protein
MDKLIGIGFAAVYVVLACFLALLGSVHGPHFFPYFMLGYLCIAEVVLWSWYFFVRRRGWKRKTLLLVAGAVGLGISIIGASPVISSRLNEWEFARLEQQAAATEVFDLRDELLRSPNGNPIGLRLMYSIRFPRDYFNHDAFWQSASLQPQRDLAVGTWAEGRRTDQKIEPPMRSAAGGLQYEEGKVYHFTTEFLSNFLIWNAEKTRLCTLKPPPEYAVAFEELVTSGTPLRYRITMSGTKYQGLTENDYDLKTFYESAAKEGAAQLQGVGFGGTAGACK